MLPTVDWNVDPEFIKLPRDGVAIALGAFAGLSFLYGLAKKASDQLVSGLFFAGLAIVVAKFMPQSYGIRYYSLLFVAVFLGGHALLKWQIVRGGGPAEDANDFIVYGVLGVLLGARLGHVLFYDLDKALENPVWVLEIWTGGLASHGAVLGLITAMFLFTKRRGISFLEGSDRFAFSAALGATLVRLGNLLNSEIVGKKTDGTWGFRFPRFDHETPAPLRHPSQIYEIVLGLTVLGLLFVIDRRLGKEKRPRGALISAFFLMYFCGRFGVEFFKEYDGISPDSPLRMGQILSIPGILLGLYGLSWSFKKRIPAGWPHAELPPDATAADKRSDEEEDEDEDEDEADEADEADDDRDEEEDEADDDDRDEADDAEEGDEEEDEEAKRPRRKVPNKSTIRESEKKAADSADPDVESEFDEQGRLKRVRE
ncbi:MAG: prolipoprotein diacylglyceryl transferase [Myxococcota bacterium]